MLPEYADKVDAPQNSTYTYYPQGAGDTIGNIKYEISGIPVDSKISCIAEVGEGKIRLMGYKIISYLQFLETVTHHILAMN